MSERTFYWIVIATCLASVVFDVVRIIKVRREHREFMERMRDQWRKR